jgi:hypothetical protein
MPADIAAHLGYYERASAEGEEPDNRKGSGKVTELQNNTKRVETPVDELSNPDDELDAIVKSVSNGKVTTLKKL